MSMYPQQPYGAPTPGNSQPTGQFDFIVNAGNKRPNWLLNAPLKTRIMVVAGSVVAILLIAWIFIALLSGGSDNTTRLVSVAQKQTELARVAKTSVTNIQSPALKDLATNVQFSVTSDEQSLIGYLQTTGNTPSNTVLAQGKSIATDQQLAAAATNGTYDQTYLSIAQAQLSSYAMTLKQIYAATASPRERTLLSAAYAHAQLLIDQSNQARN